MPYLGKNVREEKHMRYGVESDDEYVPILMTEHARPRRVGAWENAARDGETETIKCGCGHDAGCGAGDDGNGVGG